ncbi:MAG: cobalamin biosynthesis protein CbiM [Desulfuromonas sp.]|uniref:energy-coupling factor ABC transporter permease n=1 Tax=Desulfuromonas sp. TaxID=892 RepID=UPI000CADA395|nr:energy-coupling factor ABC transporter permease [Desulfuromonas sp.]PLX82366.1 MAG: cobalamin biosynthesis protein CbiM [Desulfuromonas sp.]
MHMADALLSPAVGGALWAASAGTLALCSRRAQTAPEDGRVALMGVLGAFIFAAQMINFAIPGTGSSGHLGGGLLLAILLGPHAAFLVVASILLVQALLFADGGLLALGCNLFNLGLLPCLVAYPLVYRTIAGARPSPRRLWAASVTAALVASQTGALGVVLQTSLSGISALPLTGFALVMLPIHLAIGLTEGVITASVVSWVRRVRPELFAASPGQGGPALRKVLVGFVLATALTAGALSWFASPRPDGLEWSISQMAEDGQLPSPPSGPHPVLAHLQEQVALLPGYGFSPEGTEPVPPEEAAWPAVDAGTTLSGLVGGLLTLALAVGTGLLLRRRSASS